MKYKYLLPIGSVVKVKGTKDPIMIIQNNNDYLGLNYPMGFVSDKQIKSFKVKDIEEIYFIGYQNKKLNMELRRKNIDRILEEGNK